MLRVLQAQRCLSEKTASAKSNEKSYVKVETKLSWYKKKKYVVVFLLVINFAFFGRIFEILSNYIKRNFR